MAIQQLPQFFNMQFVEKDGRLASDGYLYLDQQFQALNLAVGSVNGGVPTGAINATLSTYVQHAQENPYGLNPIPMAGQLVIIGLNPPSLTTAQINLIAAANPQVIPFGTLWYNVDINKLQVYVDISPTPPGYAIQTITSV